MVNWDNIFLTQDGATIWNKFSQTLQEVGRIHFAVPKKFVKKVLRPLWETGSVRLARSLHNKAEQQISFP